jgi:hypothetical protein
MADHHDHSDYKHGEMNINQHKATYAAFGNLTKWGSLIIAVLLIFLVLLTSVPGAGLMGAGFAAVVLAGLGWLVLKD